MSTAKCSGKAAFTAAQVAGSAGLAAGVGSIAAWSRCGVLFVLPLAL